MEVPYKVKIPTKSYDGKEIEIDVTSVTALLCYIEPEKSDMAYLLSDG